MSVTPSADTGWPQCDCGYQAIGFTAEERVRDAQRHARESHGIEVTAEQITAAEEGSV